MSEIDRLKCPGDQQDNLLSGLSHYTDLSEFTHLSKLRV